MKKPLLLLLQGLPEVMAGMEGEGPPSSCPRRPGFSCSHMPELTGGGRTLRCVAPRSFSSEKAVDCAEHMTCLARPQSPSPDTDALYSLSFCCGAGVTVFLDLPGSAKTSSVGRSRTGLQARETEASRLKLQQHMLEALICGRGWRRGWRVLFRLHLDRFIALHAVCA